jgi:CBS-domain-containing membrane protein
MSTISLPNGLSPHPLAALTAADVMAEHCCVRRATEPIAAAFELLQRSHVRHIVVCNEQEHVVGVVDDRRLARVLGRMSWDELSQPLSRYMDRAVCRALATDSLRHVARLLESSASDAVVISDGTGRLVGLVTPAEVVRAVAHRA